MKTMNFSMSQDTEKVSSKTEYSQNWVGAVVFRRDGGECTDHVFWASMILTSDIRLFYEKPYNRGLGITMKTVLDDSRSFNSCPACGRKWIVPQMPCQYIIILKCYIFMDKKSLFQNFFLKIVCFANPCKIIIFFLWQIWPFLYYIWNEVYHSQQKYTFSLSKSDLKDLWWMTAMVYLSDRHHSW